VERTRVLAYLIPLDDEHPQATYDLLRREASAYSPLLARKPHIVVFTKLDLVPDGTPLPSLAAPDARAVLAISAVARRGLDALKERLYRLVADARAS
jgi:GTP-binding protein